MGRPRGKTYQTPSSIRFAMARLIDGYREDDGDVEDLAELKGLIWCFSQILGVVKVEKDLKIEEDIQEIKDRLEAKGL